MRAKTLGWVAVALLVGACSQETGRNMLTQSDFYGFQRNTTENIQAAADGGDGEAARLMGDMYYWGDTVEPDRAKAEEYWTMAAQAGNETAQARLQNLHNGQPIPVVIDGGAGRRSVEKFRAGMGENFWPDD